MRRKTREWFCVMTLKGHGVNGASVTIDGRGTYTTLGDATMDGLFAQVHADMMSKQTAIVDVPVVVFWSATPNDLDSA